MGYSSSAVSCSSFFMCSSGDGDFEDEEEEVFSAGRAVFCDFLRETWRDDDTAAEGAAVAEEPAVAELEAVVSTG